MMDVRSRGRFADPPAFLLALPARVSRVSGFACRPAQLIGQPAQVRVR